MISQLDFFIDERGHHRNSREAFRSKHKVLGKRALVILEEIEKLGKCTDRQVREHMWAIDPITYADMSSVRPRITELIDAGKLKECGRISCEVTNVKVRIVKHA